MYGYEILHDEIVENLIKNIRSGVSQHAYIFEGEKGIGSFEAAKLFSNALVCDNKDVAPCTKCTACILAKADTHPDIHIVSPNKDKKNISVEQIREVLKDAYTKPYENEKKIYIVTYGDEMNEQAQNAFLKLLEEPPEYAVFIILVENLETLLPTIRSRCEKIKFPPIKKEKIKAWLENNYNDIQNTDFLSRYAEGNIKKAITVAFDQDFMTLRLGSLDILSKLLSKNILESYDVSEFVINNKENAEMILSLWLGFLRDIALIQNDGINNIINIDFADMLGKLSNRFDEEVIICAMTEILTAQEMQRRYVSLNTSILRLAFKIKGRN